MQMRNEALIKAMEDLAQAARSAGLAARVVSLPEPEPTKAEQPERFEHRDVDGDLVSVEPHSIPHLESVLLVGTDGCESVRLSQDAINRLAQYLDGYRTDQTECDVELAEQCGRAPAVDLDAFYCAGYDSSQPPRKTGCGHPRDAHGALGCNALTDCPCERRNGS